MVKAKTVKLDNDVLEVIQNMDWSEDGLTGKLPAGQLDRDLYVKVNKALTVAGGKWNRKLSAHIFNIDPRDQIEGFVNNKALTIERDGFFETPRAVFERMQALVPISEAPVDAFYLEPSAGLGAIARALLDHGVQPTRLICVEKNKSRCDELRKTFAVVFNMDFEAEDSLIDINGIVGVDRIFMNPPFEEGQDAIHVMKAYDHLRPDGKMVSVMSVGPFFKNDKKSKAFREWLETKDYQVHELPTGSFKESGTMVNTNLVVIHKLA